MSKNTLLVLLLIVTMIVSVSVTFYRTVIKQDFQVTNIEVSPGGVIE